LILCASLLPVAAGTAHAASAFASVPDDPAAVRVSASGGAATDDAGLLQAAIDKAASTGGGLVFVGPGRYRVTRTLYVWRGVRVIGHGPTRPVFLLPDRTPGFQEGIGLMVLFTSASGPGEAGGAATRVPFAPPGTVPPNAAIPDANQGTFHSAMSNVDFEIGEGNPAAIAIRFHVAQHGILSHMDFHVGSGLAALTEVGNLGRDLRMFGGRYGILTTNTTPYWPYTLLDSVFEGQRDAAIRTHMAQMTVVRTAFRRVPVAIEIDEAYSDQVWVQDARFEDVSQAAIVISNERNALTQVGAVNAVCSNVPTFARFRESGRARRVESRAYRVTAFRHGLAITPGATTGSIDTSVDPVAQEGHTAPLSEPGSFTYEPIDALPAAEPPAVRDLPPTSEWVNVRTLGVAGDGRTDDTQALRAAVAAHTVLYLPSGHYVIRDTIALRPDTVIVALHPRTTQLLLPDATAGFDGAGAPKPLLEAPPGGTTVLSGLGIFTGAVNPRAVGVLWKAGEHSLVDDVHFHSFPAVPPDVRRALYGSGQASGRPAGRWGSQYPSLWVTRGGGGTFNGIWTPDTYAQSGFYVSDTTTPGHVYELSAEHHLFGEITLSRVENWEFLAPQTEEEASTSAEAVAIEISDSRHITIANYHGYRVTRSYAPASAAIRLYGASEVRFRNVRINAEHGYGICDDNGCGTMLRAGKFAYENAIEDVTRKRQVREREFAVYDAGAQEDVVPTPAATASTVAPNARVEALSHGFFSIAGAAVDRAGTLYFVDHHQHRIYSWSEDRGLEVVRDAPLDPVNLAADRSGRLLVVSSAGPEGTVYSIAPDGPSDGVTILSVQPRRQHPDAAAVVPLAVWADTQFANPLDLRTYRYTTLAELFAREVTTPTTNEYVSPDGSLFLRATRVFGQGTDGAYPGMDETGWRWSHALDTFGLAAVLPGRRVYVASGAENRTYSAVVQPDGTLADLAPFAERGGEAVTTDAEGNVYVANGEVFVYDRTGRALGRIDVPERPIGLAFGGTDRQRLFLLTHRTLYGVRMRVAGEPGPWP